MLAATGAHVVSFDLSDEQLVEAIDNVEILDVVKDGK